MAITKKKVKKAAKKTPVNPLDKKIITAITNGANRAEKIIRAVKGTHRSVEPRLRALKKAGKIAFVSAQGWHIPVPDYVPNADPVTANSPVSE